MSDDASGPEPRPAPGSARDLVRKRSRTYRAPDSGRMHHIGGAPDVVPVHTDDGVTTARTTPWQLADRTPAQLTAQRAATLRTMERAAAALEFEQASVLRDELAALDAEIAAREETTRGSHDLTGKGKDPSGQLPTRRARGPQA